MIIQLNAQLTLANVLPQVARFDPSKGIPDVLESFRLLRQLFVEAMDQARAQAQADGDGKARADDAQLLHVSRRTLHICMVTHTTYKQCLDMHGDEAQWWPHALVACPFALLVLPAGVLRAAPHHLRARQRGRP
jgi:hypothetical protein